MIWASQVVLVLKNPPANAGDIRDVGSTPGSKRSPGRRCGNPLWYSCLENTVKPCRLWSIESQRVEHNRSKWFSMQLCIRDLPFQSAKILVISIPSLSTASSRFKNRKAHFWIYLEFFTKCISIFQRFYPIESSPYVFSSTTLVQPLV